MRLPCPFCGDRDLEEFRFRQFAPDPSATSAVANVYERVNRTDQSVEYWQHLHGCRTWLVVRRDPTTSVIASVYVLGSGK